MTPTPPEPPGQPPTPPGFVPPSRFSPAPPGQYPATAPNNSQAVASLVLGICAIPFSCLCLGIVLGPLAIVLGLRAKNEIRQSGGVQRGDGMATAGLITGIVGAAISLIWLGFFIIGLITGTMHPYYRPY